MDTIRLSHRNDELLQLAEASVSVINMSLELETQQYFVLVASVSLLDDDIVLSGTVLPITVSGITRPTCT